LKETQPYLTFILGSWFLALFSEKQLQKRRTQTLFDGSERPTM